MRACDIGGGDHPLHRHARLSQRDIVTDRAVEKHVVLHDHADLPTQPGDVDHGEIDAVHQHAAPLGNVKALHELGQSAFTRAGGAYQPQNFAGLDGKMDVVERDGPIDPITEGDMLEGDFATDRRKSHASRVEARLRRGVENIAHPVDRQLGLMELLPHLRQPQNRRADALGQHVEGDKLADAQITGDHQPRAEIEDRSDRQLVNCLNRLAGVVVEVEHAKA